MNYEEYSPSNRIILRSDYRKFHYLLSPRSIRHRDQIAAVHNKVEAYFTGRDVPAQRTIETLNLGRCYVIVFERVDEAEMFCLAFAEHIRTEGYKFA